MKQSFFISIAVTLAIGAGSVTTALAQSQRDIFSAPVQDEDSRKAAQDALAEFQALEPGMLLRPEQIIHAQEQEKARRSTHLTMSLSEILNAYQEGNYETALKGVRPLAEAGHAGAQEMLGVMYRNGHGLPRNDAQAYHWLSLAAEQARPLAAHYLGVMYFSGDGTDADGVKALMWMGVALTHYPDGAEKERARKDAANISARLNRRERERARDMLTRWLKDKGESHILQLND